MNTNGLKIHDLSSFGRLSEMLKNEKFEEIAPDEVEASFTVKNGRVIFKPFAMDFEESTIIASGSHGIDNSLDYLLDMKIAKSDLGAGANDMLNGLSLLAAGAGIRIPESDYVKVLAKIKGTFDNPKVTTDLTGNLRSTGETVVKAVEAKVMEEVEKVEEQVREEVGDKADKIIADAEAEAERLIEEARKAGEDLVKEAEVQGDNLIKEAGDNAFKQIAAKRAAQELKRQAEKQSANLISQAEKKADELIKQARAESEKI
jgi:vacuolar-type H+-ATPase subunit H